MSIYLISAYRMTHEIHLRKRVNDNVNLCICKNCFSLKCLAYEELIFEIQSEYLNFKDDVEMKKGNMVAVESIKETQDQLHNEVLSIYAKRIHFGDSTASDDFDIVKELKNFLLKNNFRFNDFDSSTYQRLGKLRR